MARDFQPYVLPDAQDFAIEQEVIRHNQALYMYGEYAILVMLWHAEDHKAGLVERCPECYVAYGAVAKAFGQSARSDCPACFGTTFEGGYRAKVVRPIMFTITADNAVEPGARGEHYPQVASIQIPSDVRVRDNDIVIRSDNGRWRVDGALYNPLASGFRHMSISNGTVGYQFAPVRREDETTPAYVIDPTDPAEVRALLDAQYPRRPLDYSDFDDVRGPLVV